MHFDPCCFTQRFAPSAVHCRTALLLLCFFDRGHPRFWNFNGKLGFYEAADAPITFEEIVMVMINDGTETEHSQGFSTCFIPKNPLNFPRVTFNLQDKIYLLSEQ